MSDRDLLQERAPEELRYLKKHIEAIRDDPAVKAAAEAHDNAAPRFTLEAFRDGVFIDAHPCRMTIGTLALMRGVQSRCLGFGVETEPLSDYDVALAVFVLSDECRQEAINVADDPDELERAVKKTMRRLNCNLAAYELYTFMARISDALADEPGARAPGATVSQPFALADDAWADDLDLLCHEYSWTDTHALWEVPLIRVVRLKESIGARHGGKHRLPRRAGRAIDFLKAVEEKGAELRAVENE